MAKIAHWSFVQKRSFEPFLFYATIFLLPTQLGKHFWPKYSYLLGIKTDYLSPTIYLTDVCLLLLFSMWMYKFGKHYYFLLRKNIHLTFKQNKIYFITLIAIVLYSLFMVFLIWPGNKLLELYGLLKLVEMIWFAVYIATSLGTKYQMILVIQLFAISGIFESVLAIAQFFNQGSLDGIVYWLGERHFTPYTIGIANMSLQHGFLVRPYGTFSHPNVLAGYLMVVIIFTLHAIMSIKIKGQNKTHKRVAFAEIISKHFLMKNRWPIFFIITLLICSVGLLITFSRIAILCWLGVLSFYWYSSFQKKRHTFILLSVLTIICIVGFSLGVFDRFFSFRFTDESFTQRANLMIASWYLFLRYPLFGVGTYNFLPNLALLSSYQINYFALQPVHNIFLLWIVETGILGICFMIIFFKTFIRNIVALKNTSRFHFLILLIFVVAFTGSFDHYWLTLQQGQLLFSVITGIVLQKKHR